MADNNVVDILKGVVGELRDMAKSEAIIGEAITVGDKTVIPVVKISLGFGAGGGQGEDEKQRAGFGGGGGGGAKIEPAAFIIMDDKGITLLPAQKGSWGQLVDAVPDIARKISKLKDQFMPEDGKGDGKGKGKKQDEPDDKE